MAKRKFTKLDGFKFKRQAYQVPDGQTGIMIDTADNSYDFDSERDYIKLVVLKRNRWEVHEYSTGMSIGGLYDTRKDAVEMSKERLTNLEKNVPDFSNKTRNRIAEYDVINPVD